MALLEIIGFIVLILLCLIGLFLTLLGMPGNFVIFVGAVAYNLITWSMALSYAILGAVIGIAIAGEILEYIIGMRSAKKYGASKAGVAGAIIGGIIGAIVGVPVFLIGSLLGLFIGAFLGAFVVEFFMKGDAEEAFKAGIGAFKGRVGAIMVKELLGIVMIIILVMAVF
jgi:uncharacterized protein YqgC (DUF456 family)